MASNGVDLGRLDLASTATGLGLQLTSHARFASPEEGFEFAQYGLTSMTKSWIRRGNDFRLSIKLQLDGDFPEISVETLTETVSRRLGASEVSPSSDNAGRDADDFIAMETASAQALVDPDIIYRAQ